MSASDKISSTLKAAAYFLALQPLLFGMYNGLLHILTPMSGFLDGIITFFTWRSWLWLLLLYVITVGSEAGKLMRLYKKAPATRCRFDRLKQLLFSIPRFVEFQFNAVFSILIPLMFMKLTGQAFYRACEGKLQLSCIDPSSVYILSSALWVGLVKVSKKFWLSQKTISFPVIQQSTYTRLRDTFFKSIKNCLPNTLKTCLVFIPVYYIFQKFFLTIFKVLFNVYLEGESSGISFTSFLQCWLLSAVVDACIKLNAACFKIQLTQGSEVSVTNLVHLLEGERPRLEEELYLQQLSMVASGRQGNISEMFTLTHLRGYPNNWKIVLNKCVKLISEFDNSLRNGVIEPVNVKPVITLNEPKEMTRTPSAGLRRLTTPVEGLNSPFASHCCSPSSPPSALSSHAQPPSTPSFNRNSLPLYEFLFSTQPDLYVNSLLEESQSVVFAITTLSCLSARALKDDQFGVVVNDLPLVITTLLSINTTVKRKYKSLSNRAIILSNRLRDACGRGLTRIACTYAEHLEHLPLPPSDLTVLRAFGNFMEASN